VDTVFACTQLYQVAIHAYVLMTNHVHLLLTPAEKWGISRMMQCTASAGMLLSTSPICCLTL
jgi:REP element-mobilizing transposase RayT